MLSGLSSPPRRRDRTAHLFVCKDIVFLVTFDADMNMRLLISALITASGLMMAAGCTHAQNVEALNYGYKVEEVLPHDPSAYTQGLFFHKGILYESAGQYGESNFRQVELATGKVVKRENFDRKYFIEGSCVLGDRLYILTWREHECMVYNINTWQKIGTFRYQGEGWGLTTDGKSLIMSDGTATIKFLNPDTFGTEREIKVTLKDKNITYINELEYIKGEIWANVYGTDAILRINPDNGQVNSVVNCANLLPKLLRRPSTDVLNGIAYDEKTGYIYVTGKYWPKMYRIKPVKK